MFAEIVDTSSHFLHTCVGVVTHEGGEVDLVEALFPNSGVVVLGSVLGNDICGLSLNLLVGQRKWVLRKKFFKFVHGDMMFNVECLMLSVEGHPSGSPLKGERS